MQVLDAAKLLSNMDTASLPAVTYLKAKKVGRWELGYTGPGAPAARVTTSLG